MVSGSAVARVGRAGGFRLGRDRGRSGPGASASEPLSESDEEGRGVSGPWGSAKGGVCGSVVLAPMVREGEAGSPWGPAGGGGLQWAPAGGGGLRWALPAEAEGGRGPSESLDASEGERLGVEWPSDPEGELEGAESSESVPWSLSGGSGWEAP